MCPAVVSSSALAAGKAGWKVGVATVDITPKGPIWMAGYASRNHPSEGVDTPLHAKALAIEDAKGHRAVIVTTDILGFPRSVADPIVERLHARFGLSRDQVVLNSSHIHSGPVIGDNLSLMYPLDEQQLAAVKSYAANLQERVEEAVGAALNDLSPAEMSLSTGQATFAMNRRETKDGRVILGVNRAGPADREVSVLRIVKPDGTLRAVLFRYACHGTTLEGAYFRINGDFAGRAQALLEKAHPGATALFLMGCAGDANPYPRGTPELSRQHGDELAAAVEQALSATATPVRGRLRTVFDRVALPFSTPPTREQLQAELKDKDVYRRKNAQLQLDCLNQDGKLPASYPYPVQVLQFGQDLTMVALAGEVVYEYDLRIKRVLGTKGKVWVAGYSNEVFAYIPASHMLAEGGYEPVYSMIYYGYWPWAPEVEDTLVAKVKQLATKAGAI